jgi:1,4-alpha-glucan branching enzyme
VQRLVRDLNALHRALPALYEADHTPEGFSWVVVDDRAQSVAAWLRCDPSGGAALCVINATPVARPGYRVGVPAVGWWREALNTDAAAYGGTDAGNYGGSHTEDVPAHGHGQSLSLTLPPLSVLIFTAPA